MTLAKNKKPVAEADDIVRARAPSAIYGWIHSVA